MKKETVYRCGYCNKVFTNAEECKEHEKSHTDDFKELAKVKFYDWGGQLLSASSFLDDEEDFEDFSEEVAAIECNSIEEARAVNKFFLQARPSRTFFSGDRVVGNFSKTVDVQ